MSELRILHIEDDEDDIMFFNEALERECEGYTIQTIANGGDAMDFIQNHRLNFDVVVLDLNLPGINGFQLLAEIRKSYSVNNLPICILSTSSDQDHMLKCLAYGANVFFTKPSNMKDLIKLVAKICDYKNLSPLAA